MLQADSDTKWHPRISRTLGNFAALAAIAVIVSNAWVWLDPEMAQFPARAMSAVGSAQITLSTDARIYSLIVSTLHLGLLVVALLSARSLFNRFADGRVFELSTCKHLRRLGIFLILFAIVSPVVRSIISFLITMNNPGERLQLVLGFSANDFIVGLVGALLMMMGLAMAEAVRIAEDNRQII